MQEDIATRTPPKTSYHIGCSSWLDASLLADGTFYPSRQMTSDDRFTDQVDRPPGVPSETARADRAARNQRP